MVVIEVVEPPDPQAAPPKEPWAPMVNCCKASWLSSVRLDVLAETDETGRRWSGWPPMSAVPFRVGPPRPNDTPPVNFRSNDVGLAAKLNMVLEKVSGPMATVPTEMAAVTEAAVRLTAACTETGTEMNFPSNCMLTPGA